LYFPDKASLHYAQIRAELKTLGTMIGGNDLFIAAHALGLTLVTNNTREFGRVAAWLVNLPTRASGRHCESDRFSEATNRRIFGDRLDFYCKP
jgi:hypothetical protein